MAEPSPTPIPEAHRAAVEPLLARASACQSDLALRQQWIAFMNTLPVMTHTGCIAAWHGDGLVSLTMETLQPWHLGGFSGTRQVANGAAICGVMDGAFGAAANMHAVHAGNPMGGSATTDVSVQMMRPTLGPSVSIYGAATSVGRQLVFVDALLVDGTGAVTAKGAATCVRPSR